MKLARHLAVNTALAWFGVAGVAAALDTRSSALSSIVGTMLGALILWYGWRAALRAVGLWLPFALMLLLIHGFLNQQFAAGDSWIPIRPAGVAHATRLSLRLAGPMVAGALFMASGRDGIRGSALSKALGSRGTFVLLLATAQLAALARRFEAVRDAQKARGTILGPKLRHRIAAIPSIVVPVTMTTLLEADERALYLENRGITSVPPASHEASSPRERSIAILAAVAPALVLVGALCLGE